MKNIKFKNPDEILKIFNLRNTKVRRLVLQRFLDHDFAISQGFLEAKMDVHMDRVSIYRTLRNFLNKGIIHKILDDEGGIKFALCKDSCTLTTHNHHHVHFKCNVCGHTTCIESVHVPELMIPGNFEVHEVNLLISGVCEFCAMD